MKYEVPLSIYGLKHISPTLSKGRADAFSLFTFHFSLKALEINHALHLPNPETLGVLPLYRANKRRGRRD
jgi:hypothetical protein